MRTALQRTAEPILASGGTVVLACLTLLLGCRPLAAKAGEFRLGGATRQLLDLGDLLATAGDPWEYSA